MTIWLALLVTAIYGYVAAERLAKHDYAMALAYFGWAIANVGVILNMKE